MDQEKAIVIFDIYRKDGTRETHDIEVPLDISVSDLVIGLNQAYQLDIDTENIKNCYLKAEDPIALLRGNKRLSDYHVMHGTTITFREEEKSEKQISNHYPE